MPAAMPLRTYSHVIAQILTARPVRLDNATMVSPSLNMLQSVALYDIIMFLLLQQTTYDRVRPEFYSVVRNVGGNIADSSIE
jgi:hypothetical protein